MNLLLQRDVHSPEFTLGKFLIDGVQHYYTVERPWLDNHPQTSCIPVGRYQVVIAFSPKFNAMMPRLLDVPNRSGILIHPANWAHELEGCIAPGMQRTKDGVGGSRVAFNDFVDRLRLGLNNGDVYLDVINA